MDENNNELDKTTTNEPIQEEQQTVQENVEQENAVQQNETHEEKENEPKTGTQTTQSEPKKFEPMGAQKTKKKGKGGIVAVIIVLILALLAGGAYYFFTINTNPQKLFQNIVTKGFDTINEEQEKTTKARVNMQLSAEVEVDDEITGSLSKDQKQVIEDIVEIVNKTDVDLDVQVETKEPKVYYGINAKYDEEELIDAKMLIDIEKEKAYAKLEQFFDKTLEIPLDDVDFDEFKEILDQTKIFKDEKARKKAIDILKDEVAGAIKKDYCSKEKEEISIGSKDYKTTKYTLKLTEERVVKEAKSICKDLKDNDKFLDCFENSKQIKEALNDMIEEFEDIDSFDEETKIFINIYKAGLRQETVRVDFEVKDETNNMLVKMEKTEKDKFTIKALMDGEEYVKAVVEKDGKKTKATITGNDEVPVEVTITMEEEGKETVNSEIVAKMEDVGSIKLKMKTTVKDNEGIEKFDTKNAVSIDDISDEELEAAYEKFQDSKLYKIVNDFVSKYTDESTMNNNLSANVTTTPTTTTQDNQIITYDGKTTITFNVPTGFEKAYVSDTMKSFTKNNGDNEIEVTVSSSYGDEKDFIEDVLDDVKYYQDSESYTDVNVSDAKTIELNGKTYHYIEYSYKYVSAYSNSTDYEKRICIPITSDRVYDIEVESDKEVDINEIAEFLNIK